ncbi:TIGR04197 family type VII secretion effector [Carnobacterium gallinarum]|uniref:TIGR04197 family type VII secretion effector n=1 Tax=Carnobacterium gallinarum TaxID=2749 RepID=UPI000550EE77|nr:TIGR04197 family type VII secretion effector [Carnobacterium gallinarum]
MEQLKSDLGGASQKATALKNATNTLIQPVVITEDTQTTVTGNTNGQVAIKSAQDKAKQIANAVVKASSNIQSIAKEFEALDEQIGQNPPKPLGDYVNG